MVPLSYYEIRVAGVPRPRCYLTSTGSPPRSSRSRRWYTARSKIRQPAWAAHQVDGFSRRPGSKWLLVSACARGRSWRRWLCHQVHIDYFKTEADDPLYKPGEGSLVGQLGAEGGRIRACGDLAVVELCAQRSAGLAAESDLIHTVIALGLCLAIGG